MKITTKGRYAIHILYDLAVNAAEHPISVKEIATRQDISVKYTEQIMAILNKAGYVSSTRGFQGGYRLTRPLDQYVIGDVLRLTEGSAFAGRVSIYRSCQVSEAGTLRDDHSLGKGGSGDPRCGRSCNTCRSGCMAEAGGKAVKGGAMTNIYQGADQLIGNTPLVELKHMEERHQLKGRLLAKLATFKSRGER